MKEVNILLNEYPNDFNGFGVIIITNDSEESLQVKQEIIANQEKANEFPIILSQRNGLSLALSNLEHIEQKYTKIREAIEKIDWKNIQEAVDTSNIFYDLDFKVSLSKQLREFQKLLDEADKT